VRIMFVINGLGTGGAERSLGEMLPIFERGSVSGTIVCLDRRSEGVQASAEASGADVRFVSAGGWVGRVRGARELISEMRPDLVHTTIFEADVVGRLAAVRTATPLLTSLVNTSYARVRAEDPAITPWKLSAARQVDGWTARHLTAHFHAITNAVKDAAVGDLRIQPSRITVVERGRDPGRLGLPSADRRAEVRRRLGVDPDHPVLVTVGRQEFQKGQWHLIDAMPRVLGVYPETRLLIAGRTGNASDRLQEAMRRARLNGQVEFLGHRDDVPNILAAADLFVFPSLYEGLGGALIEAMALGLPIVASDLPAIREVVDDGLNAVLVPPGSPSELAAAITSVLADPARRLAMGRHGRRIFEERFTLERSATRMLELFERVAAQGRRGR
jgi:glycosyltransferase involved in cell wall biosynthesis